jgi:hypothetical protein
LGPLVADLTKLGMTIQNVELATVIPTYAKKAHHEVKAEDFLMAWTQEHPTFRAIEAVQHFRASGRTDGACYTALRMLAEARTLKKLGPGNYARNDVKAIAAPKNKTAKPEKTKRPEISHGDFILRLARRQHGRFTIGKVKEVFLNDGRNAGSVSPTVDDLLTKKRIRRISDGMYELIPDAPAKNGNGAAPVEGVAIHG